MKGFLVLFLALIGLSVAENYLKVLLQSASNPSGQLQDGTQCNEFSFVGAGCDIWIKATLTVSDQSVALPATKVSSLSNTATINQILQITDITEDVVPAFKLSITLSSDEASEKKIDEYDFEVTLNAQTGAQVYVNKQNADSTTSLTFAWATNLPLLSSTTVQTYTGSTLSPPTTPFMATSCDEIVGVTTGLHTIYPDGSNPVEVYCEVTTNGALTVVQSRGESDNTVFGSSLETYKQPIGTAGRTTNFWLGLINLNLLTKNSTFNMAIELCCGNTLVQKLYYFNVTVGNAANNYRLQAVPDQSSIGLDYNGPAKDLNAPFSTADTYTGNKMLCDELGGFYDDDDVEVKPNGGWWFGSCSNNLNGAYVKMSDLETGTCRVKDSYYQNYQYLGVNMRTNASQVNGYDANRVSFTRARMVLFKFDPIIYDHDGAGFCK